MNYEQAKRILLKSKELKRAKDALFEEETDEYRFIGLNNRLYGSSYVNNQDIPQYTENQSIFVNDELFFDLQEAFGAKLLFQIHQDKSVTGWFFVDDIAFHAYTQDTKSILWKIAIEQEGDDNE